ncbi:hypothetical protein D3C74_319070 [compost metagenome]
MPGTGRRSLACSPNVFHTARSRLGTMVIMTVSSMSLMTPRRRPGPTTKTRDVATAPLAVASCTSCQPGSSATSSIPST